MSGAFVGRDRPLALARDAVARVAQGQGCVVVVAGEAGIGKSRLAREVVALGAEHGMEVVWTAGWSAGGAPPYWPWPEVLRVLDRSAGDALELLTDAPESERFARFRSAAEVLWRGAADRPLLVVLDDVQNVDADGLLFTRFVARALPGHRVLLVLTRRTHGDVALHAAEQLDEIARESTVCRLEGLSADDVRELLASRGEASDPSSVTQVLALTAGNPFLIEQVLDGGLHRHRGPVPDPVQRLTTSRLDELSPPDRSLIEIAAVTGSPVVPFELARVARTPEAEVLATCRRATVVGLLKAGHGSDYAFVHELAREAVLASMPPEQVADLHGRCFDVIADAPATPEQAMKRVQHAFARASYSDEHAGAAIEVARDTAAVLSAHGSPETAVDVLTDALTLHVHTQTGSEAPLLLELGNALLATGQLLASREVFARAVRAADGGDEVEEFARAALGLGGVWVLEHRTAEEWHWYLDVLDRAIEQIETSHSPARPALLAVLQLRRSAELAAMGDVEADDVLAAAEEVRAVGSASDVVAGLSLLHHMVLGPEHAHERVAIADELAERARACGDELHLLMGLLWQAVDALLLGRDAERTLAELRARADALGMRAILFVTDAIDVMRRMRAGELVDAEAAAADCHQRGREVGDADAENYYAAQTLAIHWYRGTAGELLDVARVMAGAPSTPVNNPVFTAAVAAIAAASGDRDTAEQALRQLRDDQLKAAVSTSTWLVTMFCVVEAAAHLDDPELAEEAYALLSPYEALPTMAAVGIACFGSTARTLGIAARVAGRLDDAVGHLEFALEENQRLGNRVMCTITRGDLAETLMMRRFAGDRAKAAYLVDEAVDGAGRFGLTGRAGGWRELRERIESDDVHPAGASLERLEDGWLVTVGEEQSRVPHSTGMEYLSRLLASPGVDITAGALAGVDLVSAPQELLDRTALESVRRRIVELEAAADAAALRDDGAEASRLQTELDALVAHVRTTVGPGGRSRRFDDAGERARTSVQKAIRRAIAAIERESPPLADTLRRSVKTGYQCRYEPADGAPERWEIRDT